MLGMDNKNANKNNYYNNNNQNLYTGCTFKCYIHCY